ncbi:MAG: MFS transporter [Calditrichia bacterium]
MMTSGDLRLQLGVFALSFAAFVNVYLPQPVLPVMQEDLYSNTVYTSLIISVLFLGIAFGNIPFGMAIDRLPIRPIVLAGGSVVAVTGAICWQSSDLRVIIAARFLQGFFLPAITSCLAAYLSRTLPRERLNQVLGGYVAATVAGGLVGRMISGLLLPAEEWRTAFLIGVTITIIALAISYHSFDNKPLSSLEVAVVSFSELLRQKDVRLILISAGFGMAAFASVFNFLPYRLQSPPFTLPVRTSTLFYLPYLIGTVAASFAGWMSNRFSNGITILAATGLLVCSMMLIMMPSLTLTVVALLGMCAGFFALHSAMLATLNRKLNSGHGRANALYVLFYYVGAWLGITVAGLVYESEGWNSMVAILTALLIVPLSLGLKR